jgi:hypothetical protein
VNSAHKHETRATYPRSKRRGYVCHWPMKPRPGHGSGTFAREGSLRPPDRSQDSPQPLKVYEFCSRDMPAAACVVACVSACQLAPLRAEPPTRAGTRARTTYAARRATKMLFAQWQSPFGMWYRLASADPRHRAAVKATAVLRKLMYVYA